MSKFLRWLGSFRHRAGADYQAYQIRQNWAEKGVTIAPTAILYQETGNILEIGAGTSIGPYCNLHLQHDALRSDQEACVLQIGHRTMINEFCNLRASGGQIQIGDDCMIAQFVSIIASNHTTSPERPIRDQPWDRNRRNVIIGNDVWLGANVVVLPGVTVGNGSIIGAGAVVSQDIAEGVIAVGIPAKVIGSRK